MCAAQSALRPHGPLPRGDAGRVGTHAGGEAREGDGGVGRCDRSGDPAVEGSVMCQQARGFGPACTRSRTAHRWSRSLRCSVSSTLNVAQHGTLLLPEPAIRR
jgi:hypothetical protein